MQTTSKPTNTNPASASSSKSQSVTGILNASVLVLSTILAVYGYRAAWGNYFTGDDFVYINWLRTAWIDPNKLWNVFWTNSLDAVATHFYRPLLSLSMALDKYIWDWNALGFHFTNLLFHAACSALVFFIVKDLLLPQLTTAKTESTKLWPSLSAGLFLLYPLHPEVVTWIGGRVDTFVTAFFLAALYCFGRWRMSERRRWFNLSIGSAVLALCSKESAIVLPPVLVAYEYFSNISYKPQTPSQQSFRVLKSSISSTKAFWLVLAVYFVVRRISLGTFIGGYDNSLCLGTDFSVLCANWLNSIAMMLVPVNLSLIEGGKTFLLLIWAAAVIALLGSLFAAYLRMSALRPQVNCLFAMTVLTLIPVYKLMSICTDLQSSRLAYLATAPLCCLLALGCCTLALPKFKQSVALCAGISLLGLAAFFLHNNNVAWKRAGEASNSVQATLKSLMTKGVSSSIMFGLPDTICGAYVCRNALGSMTDEKVKVTSLPPLKFQCCPPYTKNAIIDAQPPSLFAWRNEGFELKPILVPAKSITEPAVFAGENLRSLVDAESLRTLSAKKTELLIQKNRLVAVKLPLRRSAIDGILVEVDSARLPKSFRALDLQLFFPNSITGQSVIAGCDPHLERDRQLVVFATRGHSDWIFDGQESDVITISSANAYDVFVKSVSFIPLKTVAPVLSCTDVTSRLDMQHPNRNHQLGMVEFTSSTPATTIRIDASKVKNAAKVRLELSRPDIPFDYPNSSEQNERDFPTRIDFENTTAEALISRKMLKPGLCTVRAWALDKHGAPTGLASDHLYLASNSD